MLLLATLNPSGLDKTTQIVVWSNEVIHWKIFHIRKKDLCIYLYTLYMYSYVFWNLYLCWKL